MSKNIIRKNQIESMEGLSKTHYLNPNAQRLNKSLGDLVGLTGLGFHIIEIAPGFESTEKHVHYYEDECTYVLQGEATVVIGEESYLVGPGDFIGYPAGGEAHTMINTGDEVLKCIAVGQRLAHDVADYPDQKKRIFRNQGMPWNLVDIAQIDEPQAGKK